jgi:LysR family hydrogen peroxide-inducible transcriptional activator
MITVRQLRYFDALVRTLHFGRAADAVGVTQPALSMQIRELEAILGGQLLERGPVRPRLTALGAELAERAGHILSALRGIEELAVARREPLTGPLRLGIIPSVAPYLLPKLLPILAERHPELKLTLREAITEAIVGELKEGDLDAVLISLPAEDPALDGAEAIVDRFMLAVPAGSELAKRDQVTPSDVSADALLLLADGHCLRDQALSVCHTIDPKRLRSFGATSLTTIVAMVAAGQGVTLLPALAADAAVRADQRLRLVPFADPPPGRTLGVAWRKESPRSRDYLALREAIAAVGPPVLSLSHRLAIQPRAQA